MSKVRNADELAERIRGIDNRYQHYAKPLIDNLRSQLNARVGSGELADQILEIHERTYFVDGVLEALNWSINPEEGLPNTIPEVGIRSAADGNIKRLDYLGVSRRDGAPLFVVETKRPNVPLPPLDIIDRYQLGTMSTAICKLLAGENIAGGWQKQLDTLRDYIRSIHEETGLAPKRAVTTNGEWFIIFLNPTNTFLEPASLKPNEILVFETKKDLAERALELFSCLEYTVVCGKDGPHFVPLAQLAAYIGHTQVHALMFSVLARYHTVPQYTRPAPSILIKPVILIHAQSGAWFGVAPDGDGLALERDGDKLAQHLQQVEHQAQALLLSVNQCLGHEFQPTSIAVHYSDPEVFYSLRSVTKKHNGAVTDYLIVTGSNTHFIRLSPSVPNCPHHDWAASHKAGMQVGTTPISAPLTETPKSFFVSGNPQHCAHRTVTEIKTYQVHFADEPQTGPRSNMDWGDFCELIPLDHFLCCRTCVFEFVCTQAAAFQWPCGRR